MNILIINVNTGKEWGWGGIESHTDLLAFVLAGNGHRVIMGCWKEGSVAVQAGKFVLPSRRITIRNSGDISAIVKIIKICLRDDIQVIIANAGREYWPAAIAAKISGIKIILIRHQTDRLKFTTRWLVNRFVDKIIAVSGAVKGSLIRSGIALKKIEIIYNSIVLSRFNPSAIDRDSARKELGIKENDIVVGSVGKLNVSKGVFDLLSAFSLLSAKYPGLKLLYVGDGPDRAGLEKETQKLSVKKRVVFTGVRQDIERLYAAMDIFVIPSSCDEAFGMVLIEAMAMSKPVIATSVGGIPEIVTDEVNGLLVPPKDPGAIAMAISRYLDNTEFSRKVASEGRKLAEHKFSDKTMEDNFERVLKQIVRLSADNNVLTK